MLNYSKKYTWGYYYQFQEIVGKALDNTGKSLNDLFDAYNLDYALSGLFNLVEGDYVLKAHIQTLWDRLKVRYGDEYFVVSNKKLNLNSPTAEDVGIIRIFVVTLVSVIMNTYDRYSVILDSYANAKTRLMDKLRDEGNSITRFNDTPQNEEDDDEFENDEHVTNLTNYKTENAREVMTPIARLEELTRLYDNIIKDWTDEFKGVFIEEANI